MAQLSRLHVLILEGSTTRGCFRPSIIVLGRPHMSAASTVNSKSRPDMSGVDTTQSAERRRQAEARGQRVPWWRWGPYLSERHVGTVREDYSPGGTAWDSFPHDHARSRAYRWGEDGLLGIRDNHGQLCFALALWN